ncbi:uncharacterized protein PRCAT00003887001 [Priceomyces carsonii]|uniref:uncharacterized protein n=1 Tax=Priceomyces carsonii TaxID=28549 RepID=UPI002ED870D3|nr:unnamed protein product [Priceomyces carsonii]
MNTLVDCSRFEKIDSNEVDEHIFDIFTNRPPPDDLNLGFIDRSREIIDISLEKSGMDISIQQSFSGVSTGFLCWKTAAHISDWILGDAKCPFHSIFRLKAKDLLVIELGAGVSAICALVLSPLVNRYIATDQKELLRLLSRNFYRNQAPSISTSKRLQAPRVDFLEYDWEEPEVGYQNLSSVLETEPIPDFIIACDTIYNEFLVPKFVAAIKRLMHSESGALVAIQLRDQSVTQFFIEEVMRNNLTIYSVPPSCLSSELTLGFVVYYITIS